MAVIFKMRPIIKVWVRFLTRARTQTFLEKDLSKLLFRAAAGYTRGAAARWGKVGIMKGLGECARKNVPALIFWGICILILKEPAQAGK